LKYRDADNGLMLTFEFETDPVSYIIRAKTTLQADAPVHLHWLAASDACTATVR
jgi:alpha-galactosidase